MPIYRFTPIHLIHIFLLSLSPYLCSFTQNAKEIRNKITFIIMVQ